jgi:hypothetical protein
MTMTVIYLSVPFFWNPPHHHHYSLTSSNAHVPHCSTAEEQNSAEFTAAHLITLLKAKARYKIEAL